MPIIGERFLYKKRNPHFVPEIKRAEIIYFFREMGASSVFEMGKLEVHVKSVNQSNSSSPPKSLLISYPTQKGDYGVVLFLHGFLISNSFYKELLSHISSHGYIVVAPSVGFPSIFQPSFSMIFETTVSNEICTSFA